MHKPEQLKNEWSLFLDRDGVINKRIVGGYVTNPDEFEFLPGSLEAIKQFSAIFKNIFIVTNQQGIGKGLMTHHDLESVHQYMLDQIRKSGGRIDRVFYCPDLDSENLNCRKPGLWMAQTAKTDFPSVDFSKSYMAGDSKSDMEFGQNAGMHCVFIHSELQKYDDNIPTYASLIEFAKNLKTN